MEENERKRSDVAPNSGQPLVFSGKQQSGMEGALCKFPLNNARGKTRSLHVHCRLTRNNSHFTWRFEAMSPGTLRRRHVSGGVVLYVSGPKLSFAW